MPQPSPIGWVAARGGVAHTRDLRAAGFTEHAIRSAVDRGDADRVRRSWIVLPSAQPARRVAASVGGRVTCVSAGSLLGLWTPAHERVQVGLPHGTSAATDAQVLVHRAVGPAPVSRTAPVDPLVNVLFHVARCLPGADALAVWESAIRRRLIDPLTLGRIRWRCATATYFGRRASSLSDSGIETAFVDIVRSMGVPVRQQVWIDGHPVDGVIGDRLVVQIDGFAHHSDARDRRRDLAADARLTLMGYTVLRFDFHQVLFQSRLVQETIALAMAQGLHRSPAVA